MHDKKYALVLGVSGELGYTSALQLASQGYRIFGVHMGSDDYRVSNELQYKLSQKGNYVKIFSIDATEETGRSEVMSDLKIKLANSQIDCFVHTITNDFSGPLISSIESRQLSQRKLDLALNTSAMSLLQWTQDLFSAQLIKSGSKIVSVTRAFSKDNCGAKLLSFKCKEAILEQFSHELAPEGICTTSVIDNCPSISFEDKYSDISKPELAGVIKLISESESNYINGQIFKLGAIINNV